MSYVGLSLTQNTDYAVRAVNNYSKCLDLITLLVSPVILRLVLFCAAKDGFLIRLLFTFFKYSSSLALQVFEFNLNSFFLYFSYKAIVKFGLMRLNLNGLKSSLVLISQIICATVLRQVLLCSFIVVIRHILIEVTGLLGTPSKDLNMSYILRTDIATLCLFDVGSSLVLPRFTPFSIPHAIDVLYSSFVGVVTMYSTQNFQSIKDLWFGLRYCIRDLQSVTAGIVVVYHSAQQILLPVLRLILTILVSPYNIVYFPALVCSPILLYYIQRLTYYFIEKLLSDITGLVSPEPVYYGLTPNRVFGYSTLSSILYFKILDVLNDQQESMHSIVCDALSCTLIVLAVLDLLSHTTCSQNNQLLYTHNRPDSVCSKIDCVVVPEDGSLHFRRKLFVEDVGDKSVSD